jgi:hypothetical protein
MASILKVNEIQHTGGTSALTVDSSGNIDIANFICQGFVLTSAAVGDQNPITGWGRYETTLSGDGAGHINNGGNITNTSSIFSYPMTGLYKIEFFATFAGGSTDSTVQYSIDTTTDNSSYSNLAQVKDHSYGSGYKGNITMTALQKVTNTSLDKFKFVQSSFGGHTTEASSTEALTYFFVTRLGNAS